MGKEKSIITDDMEHCFICGAPHPQIHHIFFGTANRKQSDLRGCIVPLCLEHHTGSHGVHSNRNLDLALKAHAQLAYEKEHTREEFRGAFGKSYL